MNYKDKYLKYKRKYLNLKKNYNVMYAGAGDVDDAGAATPVGDAAAYVDKDVERSINKLFNDLYMQRVQAIHVIMKSPAGQKYTDKVALLMEDQSWYVRLHAVKAMGEMGDAGARYVGKVASLLNDTMQQVRDEAVQTLTLMKGIGSNYVDNGYNQSKYDLLFYSAYDRGQAKLFLSDAFDEEFALDYRVSRLNRLVKMGKIDDAGVKKVALLLKDSKESKMRSEAAKSLSLMGNAGAAYAQDVALLLKDSDEYVRSEAAKSLALMGDAGAAYAENVALLLKDSDEYVRSEAAKSLALMGAAGAAYAQDIFKLSSDSSEYVKNEMRHVIPIITNLVTKQSNAAAVGQPADAAVGQPADAAATAAVVPVVPPADAAGQPADAKQIITLSPNIKIKKLGDGKLLRDLTYDFKKNQRVIVYHEEINDDPLNCKLYVYDESLSYYDVCNINDILIMNGSGIVQNSERTKSIIYSIPYIYYFDIDVNVYNFVLKGKKKLYSRGDFKTLPTGQRVIVNSFYKFGKTVDIANIKYINPKNSILTEGWIDTSDRTAIRSLSYSFNKSEEENLQ